MNQSLHLIQSLETHLDQIRQDLGAEWPEFAAQVWHLAPAFEAARNDVKLAIAVGELYLACRAREPVMKILRQTADTSGADHDRRPPAGGTGHEDMMKIREVINRYQSLLDKLREIESLDAGRSHASENRNRGEVPIDRRAHP